MTEKLKIGSLFSGYGGLDLALHEVLGAEPAWFCEWEDGPSKILAHHWPNVPNHRDVTKVDWSQVEPVHIISGGSPCQDLSSAGKRAGMTEGTRSNLWVNMREAIIQLRPKLVVWENVLGALSAEAYSDSDVEPGSGHLGVAPNGNLRALGRVLGDLAEAGYDAQWQVIRASDVGAPHHRARVFLVAYPAGPAFGEHAGESLTEKARSRASFGPRDSGREQSHGDRREGASDTADDGFGQFHDGPGGDEARSGRLWKSPGSVGAQAATDAEDGGLSGRRFTGGSEPQQSGADCSVGALSDTDCQRRAGRTGPGAPASGRAPSGPEGRDFGGEEKQDSDVSGRAVVRPVDDSDTNWGDYWPAVHRWETVTRPAPPPTILNRNGRPQLNPRFAEWLMGIPDGHVTDPAIWTSDPELIAQILAGVVPPIARAIQLKAIGNGVCPPQAVAALRLLLGIYDPAGVAA